MGLQAGACADQPDSSPRSAANATAWARFSAPSLLKIAVTWNLTVRSEIESVRQSAGWTTRRRPGAARRAHERSGVLFARALREPVHELGRDPRPQIGLARVDLPDRLRDLGGRRSFEQVAARAARIAENIVIRIVGREDDDAPALVGETLDAVDSARRAA